VTDPNIVPGHEAPLSRRGDDEGDLLAEAIQASVEPLNVPVNMYATDEAIVIVGAMPGVTADDVEITVERRRVWLRAANRSLAPKRYLLHEWHYGPYERLVELPEGFEGEPSAHFGNGQVALRVPRGGHRAGPVVVVPGSG
jgi:HSP20 family molecular chaperone IbpA